MTSAVNDLTGTRKLLEQPIGEDLEGWEEWKTELETLLEYLYDEEGNLHPSTELSEEASIVWHKVREHLKRH